MIKNITRIVILYFLTYYLCYTSSEMFGFEQLSFSKTLYFVGATFPFYILCNTVLVWTFGETVNVEVTPDVKRYIEEKVREKLRKKK